MYLQLAALVAVFACTSALDWRGISPDLQHKLNTASGFTCDKGEQRLELERLNDNYCDCIDGSDEPGTSACSHTSAVFHCVNAGFVSIDLPTSRVNDGVCDCCDGSDEYASSVSCSRNCLKEMEAFKADRKDLLEQVEAGLKDRNALVSEAQTLWNEAIEKKTQLETSVTSKKIMIEQLTARKEEEERLEKEEKAERLKTSKSEILTQLGLLEMTKEQLLSIIVEIGRNGLQSKTDLLPIIRKEREMQFNGEGDLPSTVMDEQDQAFRQRDEERQKETLRIEKLIEERRKEQENKVEGDEAGEGEASESKEEDELTLPEVETHPFDLLYKALDESERYERSHAILARKRLEDIKREVAEEEKNLNEVQQLLEKEYGEDRIFFALRNKCVESKAGQYTYKICFYGKATQDLTRLGNMEDIGDKATEETEEMQTIRQIKFSNGEKCWNGPHRSLTVNLQCGPDPMELFDIEEPSTCVYMAKLRLPAVCRPEDRDQIMALNDAKVEPHYIEIEVPPV